MRAAVLLSASLSLAAGCVEELEVSGPADCALIAPDEVALGEAFELEVSCAGPVPSWFELDLGDGRPLVRTASTRWRHRYGDEAADHLWFRVQVFYTDADGQARRLEAIIERRFE